jgi:hypothetical protein
MRNKLALSTSLIALMALSGCQEYLTRSDLVSPYSGDAVARNASNQTIDPWPRYVYDTDLRTSGERQAGAIRKYNGAHDKETGQPQLLQLTPAAPPSE